MDADWNTLAMDVDLNFDTSNVDFDIPHPGMPNDNPMPSGDFFSQELLALGLLEPLPPQDMMDELYVTLSSVLVCMHLPMTPGSRYFSKSSM